MTRVLRALALAALLALPARAAITLDATACGSTTGFATCPRGTDGTAANAFVNTNSFSTGASGQLLIAIATVENAGPPTISIAQQSGTGTYSTGWTVVQDCNDPFPGGSGTRTVVWRAITSSALTTVVIRATFGSASAGTIMVFPFASSSTTLGVSTCVTQTAAGVASVTLAGTTSGSVLLGGAMEGMVGATTFTPNGSTTTTGPNAGGQFTDNFTDVSVVFRAAGTGGSVTLGGTWSSSGQGAAAGVEVLDAGGGGPTTVPRGKRHLRGSGARLHLPDLALPRREVCA